MMTFCRRSLMISPVIVLILALTHTLSVEAFVPSTRGYQSSSSALYVSYQSGNSPGVSSSFSNDNNPFDEDQYVFISKEELDEQIEEEKQKHEQQCNHIKLKIEEQRHQLTKLKEMERKERMKHQMNHDAETTNDLTMLWSENHQQKMKRMANRLDYLFEENYLLQERLHLDRDKHVEEMRRLDEQYQIAKAKTTEAKQVLQLERAYYDTCVNLLEAGLERETKKVEALKEKLQFQRLREERRQGHRIDEQLPIRTRQIHQNQQPHVINQFGPSQARPFQPYSSSTSTSRQQYQQQQRQYDEQQVQEEAQWYHQQQQPHNEPLRRQYNQYHHPPGVPTASSSSRYVQSNNNIKGYNRSTGSTSSRRRNNHNTNNRYTISSMDGYDFRIDDNMYFQ